MKECAGSTGGIILMAEDRSTLINACLKVTLSTANPTQSSFGINPGIGDGNTGD